jgi:ATP-binding cassette subfamily F protein 3
MIQCSDLTKEFSGRILFNNVTFSLNKGEKVGFVGRNGTGKSTLFKILMKEITPDSGEITIPKHYRIGMLKQHLEFTQDSVLKECMQVLPDDMQFDEYRAQAILHGLGFSDEDMLQSPNSFSGGYQIRINLAKLLLEGNDLLLLDEPTNYLDIVSMRWLEKFLKQFAGEVVLITHDREFMNKVSTHIMGLHRQKLMKVKGDFGKYQLQQLEEERVYENTRSNQEKRRKEIENFVNKFRAKARQASLAQSRQKMLEKMEEFEKLEDVKSLDFHFNYMENPAKTLISTENVSFGYDKEHPLFHSLSFSANQGDRIAIIGKNGKGKSTLLNILASRLVADTGEVKMHHGVAIGHFGQTNIQVLHEDNTIEQEIASANSDLSTTQVRNICGTMMFSGDDSQKKIKVLSGGEKSRVLLGKILARKNNVLLLDEPTNHLDQESVESLVNELKKFKGVVLIVTHSEMILRQLATKLIVFHHDKCEEFLGNYDDFLDKIGWEEEIESKQPAKEKLTRKEYKKLRSDLINERSRATRDLKKSVEVLENKIMELEGKLEIINEQLVSASSAEDGKAIADLSQKLNETEALVEASFQKLEEDSNQLHELESQFEQKLKELDQKV